MSQRKMTAHYRITSNEGGNRYLFYCDVSDALGCTTEKTYSADSPHKELCLAWEEGRQFFCQCGKCGRWVIDAMFNADVLECVDCAPYEAEPRFCKSCGVKIKTQVKCCPSCGKPLTYEGAIEYD